MRVDRVAITTTSSPGVDSQQTGEITAGRPPAEGARAAARIGRRRRGRRGPGPAEAGEVDGAEVVRPGQGHALAAVHAAHATDTSFPVICSSMPSPLAAGLGAAPGALGRRRTGLPAPARAGTTTSPRGDQPGQRRGRGACRTGTARASRQDSSPSCSGSTKTSLGSGRHRPNWYSARPPAYQQSWWSDRRSQRKPATAPVGVSAR